jgi:spermidine synthase
MRHWELLGTAPITGTGDSMLLFKGKDDYSIRLKGGYELMNTRKHGSEDALGRLPCQRLKNAHKARVLVGGLGMGFTLAAVLAEVGADARVTVAELVPEVVEWNRGPLGEASGYPLNDPRVRVRIGEVGRLLRAARGNFDVIALDVDNGPAGLTARANDWLYTIQGINAAQDALRPGGVLAYWSAAPDRKFQERLRRCGFDVDEVRVHAHGTKGTRHVIWILSL